MTLTLKPIIKSQHSFLSISNLNPQSQITRFPITRRGGGGVQKLWLRGASLPLPRSPPPPPPPHRHFLRSLFQTPPLLPPPFSLSPPLQALLHHLTTVSNKDSSLDLGSEPDLVPDKVEVEKLCKVINESLFSDRDMDLMLTECGIGPTHSLVVSVIDRFRNAHKPAYRFFRWAGSVPSFAHDPVTYNKILNVLGRNRQFEIMVELLEEMGTLQMLSMESFKIAIHSFAFSNQIKRCLWVFQLMKRFGFDARLETFNCLLDMLAKEKLGKEAQKLFDKMSGQYTPDIITYTALLAGWCKVNYLVKACRVWKEMLDRGFKPDIAAYYYNA